METKFLSLRHPVELGSRFDDWQVCWLGGWDKHRHLPRRTEGVQLGVDISHPADRQASQKRRTSDLLR